MKKLQFEFMVKPSSDGKSNLMTITSITTEAKETYAIPEELKLQLTINNTNLTIRGNLTFSQQDNSKEMHDHLTSVCAAIHHRLQSGSSELMEEAINTLNITMILSVPLLDILKDDTSNNVSIKLCKGLVGYEVGMESKMYDMDFTPIPAEVTTISKRNVRGFSYKVYFGLETIYFRKGGMAGFFVHNGDIIQKIVSNYTDLSKLRSILKVIAVYIKCSCLPILETRDVSTMKSWGGCQSNHGLSWIAKKPNNHF